MMSNDFTATTGDVDDDGRESLLRLVLTWEKKRPIEIDVRLTNTIMDNSAL